MTIVSWSFVFADQIHLTYDDYEFQLSSISFSNGDFRAYAYNPFGLVTSVSSSSGTTLKLQTCHTTTSLTDDPNHCFKVLSNGLVKQKLQVHQSGKVSSTQSTSGKYLPICTQIGKVGNTDNAFKNKYLNIPASFFRMCSIHWNESKRMVSDRSVVFSSPITCFACLSNFDEQIQ